MSKFATANDTPTTSSGTAVPTLAPSTAGKPTAHQAVNGSTASANSEYNGYRLPENATLIHAVKLAIVEDKPILLDYWTYSIDKQVLIGVKEGKDGSEPEKLLVKSAEEYTSPIIKIYGSGKEYIIITENSIYIVDKAIPTKRISS
jgi:hypothetical protein